MASKRCICITVVCIVFALALAGAAVVVWYYVPHSSQTIAYDDKTLLCYNFTQDYDAGIPPHLPADAKVEKCAEGKTKCMKRLDRFVEKGTGRESFLFQWGCAPGGPDPYPNANFSCGDIYEVSTVDDQGFTVYTKSCMCCGDGCNGVDMDNHTKCNERPVFTKHCFAAASTQKQPIEDNHLPSVHETVPCTATQSCLKYATYDFQTGQSRYNWGCVSTMHDRCDFSDFDSGNGTILRKGCSCCGDSCNGQEMDGIYADDSTCTPIERTSTGKPLTSEKMTIETTSAVPLIQCNFFTQTYVPNVNQTGNLPAEATLQQCSPGENTCIKRQLLRIEKDGGQAGTYFQWACGTKDDYKVSEMKAAEDYELTIEEASFYTYSMTCPCSGDGCNNGTMDDLCMEPPDFTKKCYGASKSTKNPEDGQLPSDAAQIPCTSSQSCMKYSNLMLESGWSNYTWGCASVTSGNCESPEVEVNNGTLIRKVCSCCGDLCNGAQMDHILAKWRNCTYAGLGEDSTTSIKPTEPPETTATIVSETPATFPVKVTTAITETTSTNETSGTVETLHSTSTAVFPETTITTISIPQTSLAQQETVKTTLALSEETTSTDETSSTVETLQSTSTTVFPETAITTASTPQTSLAQQETVTTTLPEETASTNETSSIVETIESSSSAVFPQTTTTTASHQSKPETSSIATSETTTAATLHPETRSPSTISTTMTNPDRPTSVVSSTGITSSISETQTSTEEFITTTSSPSSTVGTSTVSTEGNASYSTLIETTTEEAANTTAQSAAIDTASIAISAAFGASAVGLVAIIVVTFFKSAATTAVATTATAVATVAPKVVCEQAVLPNIRAPHTTTANQPSIIEEEDAIDML